MRESKGKEIFCLDRQGREELLDEFEALNFHFSHNSKNDAYIDLLFDDIQTAELFFPKMQLRSYKKEYFLNVIRI